MSYVDNSGWAQPKSDTPAVDRGIPEKLGFQSLPAGKYPAKPGIFTFAHLDKQTLEPSPIAPDWILEGSPEARCCNLAGYGNDWTVVDHWSCTAGKFRWHYFYDETILILEGEAFITDDNGVHYHAVPGVVLSFPDGTAATWHVPDYVRKIAFNQKSVPSYLHKFCKAVNKLHRKFFK